MADFNVLITAGVTLEPWEDPPDEVNGHGTRINAQPEHEHRRYVGSLGVQVELRARTGGVTAPLDGALGGVLFGATFGEVPSFPPPALSSPAGQSSIQRFTPNATGHYTVHMTRVGHGGVIHHIDVDP